MGIKTRNRYKKSFNLNSFRNLKDNYIFKQKILGLILILMNILTVILLLGMRTEGEMIDITGVIMIIGLGVYIFCTKEKVLF